MLSMVVVVVGIAIHETQSGKNIPLSCGLEAVTRELPGKLTALSLLPSCSSLLSLASPCIARSILLYPGEEIGRFTGKRYLLFFHMIWNCFTCYNNYYFRNMKDVK